MNHSLNLSCFLEMSVLNLDVRKTPRTEIDSFANISVSKYKIIHFPSYIYEVSHLNCKFALEHMFKLSAMLKEQGKHL